MGKIRVFTDQFALERDDFEIFGDDIITVDANGGFVPFDKMDANNMKNAQENLRNRFSMAPADPSRPIDKSRYQDEQLKKGQDGGE